MVKKLRNHDHNKYYTISFPFLCFFILFFFYLNEENFSFLIKVLHIFILNLQFFIHNYVKVFFFHPSVFGSIQIIIRYHYLVFLVFLLHNSFSFLIL